MQTLETTLGLRLRAARKAAGFKTAREFAYTHEIAQSTYSQYETGKRGFNAEAMVRFCRALNINAHWLLPGVGASGKANGTSKSPFAPPAADANSFCRDRPVSSGADVTSALAFTNDSTPSATAIAGSSARALRFPASSLGEAAFQSNANTYEPFVKSDRPCVRETRIGSFAG
jgi:transcriptional regulator with XRE-family HTH domain